MLQKTREKILQLSLNSLIAISDYRKPGTTTVDSVRFPAVGQNQKLENDNHSFLLLM